MALGAPPPPPPPPAYTPASLLQACNACVSPHGVLVAVADGGTDWLSQAAINSVPHAGQRGPQDGLNALEEL